MSNRPFQPFSSIFLTEEERTGQAPSGGAGEDGDSGEIESFTSENFDEDVNRKKDDEQTEEDKQTKDEL